MGYWILKIRCINITYMWNLKKKGYRCTYLQRRNGDTAVENGCMETRGMWRRMNWDIGIDMYT